MHELRNIIHRLRQGDTSREIARTQRVSRDTVAKVRNHALEAGWLDKQAPLPCDADLARRFTGQSQRPQNLSTVEAFRDLVLTWHGQGIRATTMRAALARNHGFTGSVHAIYRFLERNAPQAGNAAGLCWFLKVRTPQIPIGLISRLTLKFPIDSLTLIPQVTEQTVLKIATSDFLIAAQIHNLCGSGAGV